jgi:hypothetical protein
MLMRRRGTRRLGAVVAGSIRDAPSLCSEPHHTAPGGARVSRRSLLPILLAALGALLTVTIGVAVNVATGGTLPDPLQGYQGWAWPIVGLLTLAIAVTVLQARQPHPAPDAAMAMGIAPSAHGVRREAPPQRVVGERVSTAVDVFHNRAEFCARLRSLVLARATPIISVTGRRGIGKSGLVAKVLADFEEPTGSTDEQVDGLAYLSTRTGVGVVDLARIFHALVRLLPAEQHDQLEEQWTNAGAGALPDLFAALADRKAVLVLDNLDDLQDPETGRLTSADLVSFLTAVCSHRQPARRAADSPPCHDPSSQIWTGRWVQWRHAPGTDYMQHAHSASQWRLTAVVASRASQLHRRSR